MRVNNMIEKRGAGILMHVTSLPSAFGIGDFGPEARKFVDFLKDSLQQYWQILPITFIDKSQRYSPYSPLSSIAGNIWLISPELLYQEGLIDKKDLELAKQSSNEAVDYQKVTEGKTSLFDTAYTHFLDMDQRGFASFCRKESWWLDDFSLFMALKKNFKQMPWCQWPKEYRNRKATSLKQFISHHETEINKTKWLQFIFYTQWRNLKDYCNGLNIKIVGDLPFYISYDSVDVWSNPDLFSIDKNGRIEEMAGVPPDYFNSSGQLWGMPVYNWPAHKKEKFSWWVNRFRKNLELSDIVRIDHFRALCQYWSVPATEKNAIKGKWRTGPGAQFFEKLKVELGELAIVAEDLGDIDSQVHELFCLFRNT